MKNKFTQKAAALLCSKKALNRARTAHRLLSMTQSSPALLLYRHLQIMKR